MKDLIRNPPYYDTIKTKLPGKRLVDYVSHLISLGHDDYNEALSTASASQILKVDFGLFMSIELTKLVEKGLYEEADATQLLGMDNKSYILGDMLAFYSDKSAKSGKGEEAWSPNLQLSEAAKGDAVLLCKFLKCMDRYTNSMKALQVSDPLTSSQDQTSNGNDFEDQVTEPEIAAQSVGSFQKHDCIETPDDGVSEVGASSSTFGFSEKRVLPENDPAKATKPVEDTNTSNPPREESPFSHKYPSYDPHGLYDASPPPKKRRTLQQPATQELPPENTTSEDKPAPAENNINNYDPGLFAAFLQKTGQVSSGGSSIAASHKQSKVVQADKAELNEEEEDVLETAGPEPLSRSGSPMDTSSDHGICDEGYLRSMRQIQLQLEKDKVAKLRSEISEKIKYFAGTRAGIGQAIQTMEREDNKLIKLQDGLEKEEVELNQYGG